MRFFDVDQPFAERRPASRLTDVERALADLEDGIISNPESASTVKRQPAPAVQALDSDVETMPQSTTSSYPPHHHPSSGYSSSLSSETLITNYGLHRALNSMTVSQTYAPAASKRARKSLRYLDDMRATHDRLRDELDLAINSYHEAFNLRDANDDPKLEGVLNRKFLSANNKLARASREYEAFVDDLNELRHLPKLSRAALQCAYTNHKIASKLDRQDEHDISMRAKLRKTRERIADLERERQDLLNDTSAVGNLTHYVKDLEIQRDQFELDLAFKDEWAIDLDKHLKIANAKAHSQDLEISSYKAQLSFARAETMRYKDENKVLRREVQDLSHNFDGALDEIARIREVNTDLRRNNMHLRDEFAEVHDQARVLERRYSDVTSSGGRRSVMEPVPFNSRETASIQEMLLEESQTKEWKVDQKAMSL